MKEMSNIILEIKGPNNSHIGLVADKNTDFHRGNYYQIIIGGWSNTRCALRKAPTKSVLVTDSVSDVYLSDKEYRSFWISWADNIISIGRGRQVGESVIFSYDDKAAPMAINYLAFSGYHKRTIQYKYYNGKF